VKILIVHQHFRLPSEGGAIRSYYLATALKMRGFDVVVVTAHNKQTYETLSIEGIEVHYLPIPYDNKFGFFARIWSFLRFVRQSVEAALRISNLDICYAISVPLTVGIVAMRLKRRKNIPYIFEVGDLWPDAPIQLGFIKNVLLQRAVYLMESRIYRDAKSIVALSTDIALAIEKKISGKRIDVIPNMADCDFYVPEKKDEARELRFEVQNKFVVSYIGAIGFANGLEYFLKCAEAAGKAQMNVHFLLCGEGAMLESLKRITAESDLQNLSFLNFTTRDGVKEIFQVTDAAFVCYRDVPILETGSPNKYFDALAAGKLIVNNFGGWIKKEIEENQCGISLNPKDPMDFRKKMKPFLDSPVLLQQFQTASRRLAETKYARNLLSEKFASIFDGQSDSGL
jgi:glycosyltransferase involved in cell wall biosynthesis